MNKKGMLLASETLKMVLAVIGIVFLIFLLTSLYFGNENSKKQVKAQATFDRLEEVIERAKLDEFTSESLTDISPSGWTLFSFTESEIKPNQCGNVNCLCICDSVVDAFDRQLKECTKDGVCMVLENLKEFKDIPIGKTKDSTSILIVKYGKWLEVSEI